MRTLIIFAALLISLPLAAQSVTATSKAAFQPVTVDFSFSFSADDTAIKNGQIFPLQAPAKVTWSWADKVKAGEVNHSDVPWPADSLTVTASHTYHQQGDYIVSITVVDTKGRFVAQKQVAVKINPPVTIDASSAR